MSFSMKKTALAASIALVGSISAAEASLVLTMVNGTTATAIAGACSGISWAASAEFRMCDPSGAALGGGFPTQKNTIFGGESYSYNDAGLMTAVGGVTASPTNPGSWGGAAPIAGTNPTTQEDASFFGPMFNFLAPTTTSLAGAFYGVETYLGGVPVNGSMIPFIFAPVLEAQWGGTHFPLGSVGTDGDGLGITFFANITGATTVGLVTTFTYEMFANELINSAEDPGSAGFTGWTAQWHQQGTGVYTAVPVPAAVWLLGSGLLGLVGIARRKKATV